VTAGADRPGSAGGTSVVTIRPEEERHFTSQVGMVVFLGSWAMMFGALFFAYAILRLKAPAWPPPDLPPLPSGLPWVATALMALSSAALAAGGRAVRAGRASLLKRALLATLALGVGFLAVQSAGWARLWEAGLRPETGRFASVFYLLTAFHALHVLVGLGLLVSLLPSGPTGGLTARRALRVKMVSMFWYFVGMIWLCIFVSVYIA
jgi:heme/copper-type cytochrome/quinol oxidase subunit 3